MKKALHSCKLRYKCILRHKTSNCRCTIRGWHPDGVLFWQLTHWGRGKIAAISQTTMSSAFSRIKMLEYRLKFHWSLFLRVQLTISQQWYQLMAWCRPGDKPLSEPMMVRLPTHICITRSQWVNGKWGMFHWNAPYVNRFNLVGQNLYLGSRFGDMCQQCCNYGKL